MTCFVYDGGVMPGRRAGSGVGYLHTVCSTVKRFSSITKTINFAHRVILFIYAPTPTFSPFPSQSSRLQAAHTRDSCLMFCFSYFLKNFVWKCGKGERFARVRGRRRRRDPRETQRERGILVGRLSGNNREKRRKKEKKK